MVLLSSNWQGSDNLLAESKAGFDPLVWEEVTTAPVALPDENVFYQFKLFLEESVAGDYKLPTLEWLSLPMRDRPYQSLYLGILNGYHVFSLQVKGDYDFNLFVFDQDGRIRDRREILWGNDGGSVDLLDQSVVQVQRYLEKDDFNGIEELNLQIDLNGQFKKLTGPEYIHPKRKFPQISASILTSQYLKGLSRLELTSMKNELLAANGYIFKDSKLQRHFERRSWYVRGSREISLTVLEEYNLILLEQQLEIE